jgi:hypothetical protein
MRGREVCQVEGKDVYPSKDEARDAAKAGVSNGHRTSAGTYRCPWGDHYHIRSGTRLVSRTRRTR